MGEILHSMIQNLEQRMDIGVLHDLNLKRLHMLLGDQLVRQSIKLPDENSLIELIEAAMQSYFQMELMEDSEDSSEKNEDIQTPAKSEHDSSQKDIKFKLNIKKNSETNFTIINQVPVIFSPVEVRKFLCNSILVSLEQTTENASETILKYIEETAFVKTIQMLTDIYYSLPENTNIDQKIRLGLVIYRILGYGEYNLEKINNQWKINLFYRDITLHDIDSFSLGFIRGVFVATDIDLYNKMEFSIEKNTENSVITGAYHE